MEKYAESQKAKQAMEPRIQRPSSKEELGALIEGDVLISKTFGNFVYTEKHGEPRLIRQFNENEILYVRIKENKQNAYEISDGLIRVICGGILREDNDIEWMQYEHDYAILKEAGFYKKD